MLESTTTTFRGCHVEDAVDAHRTGGPPVKCGPKYGHIFGVETKKHQLWTRT